MIGVFPAYQKDADTIYISHYVRQLEDGLRQPIDLQVVYLCCWYAREEDRNPSV